MACPIRRAAITSTTADYKGFFYEIDNSIWLSTFSGGLLRRTLVPVSGWLRATWWCNTQPSWMPSITVVTSLMTRCLCNTNDVIMLLRRTVLVQHFTAYYHVAYKTARTYAYRSVCTLCSLQCDLVLTSQRLQNCHARCTISVVSFKLHYVSKNDTDLAHYNFDANQPILIIFDRY